MAKAPAQLTLAESSRLQRVAAARLKHATALGKLAEATKRVADAEQAVAAAISAAVAKG